MERMTIDSDQPDEASVRALRKWANNIRPAEQTAPVTSQPVGEIVTKDVADYQPVPEVSEPPTQVEQSYWQVRADLPA